MLRRLPPIFRNFYFLVGFFLFVWMMFFDTNDFISQYRMKQKQGELEEERDFYISKIEEVKQDRRELFGSPQLLEKFAREKYMMKKPTEDVFIIEEE